MAPKKTDKTVMDLVDSDSDGVLTEEEITAFRELEDLREQHAKMQSQKQMAWTAMAAMILFTASLFMPLVSNERITSISPVFSMLYVGFAAVIGTYMGAAAVAQLKK